MIDDINSKFSELFAQLKCAGEVSLFVPDNPVSKNLIHIGGGGRSCCCWLMTYLYEYAVQSRYRVACLRAHFAVPVIYFFVL